MRLISWNTNNRIDSTRQAHAILERQPDIVALQEVTARSVEHWTAAFAQGGLKQIKATVGPTPWGRGPRAYGVLVASRYPLGEGMSLAVPWEEKALSVVVTTPAEVALHVVHVPPGSSNGWVKVEVLEAIYASLSIRNRNQPAILCGDFNAPQLELASGEVVTWGQRIGPKGVQLKRRMRGGLGQRWDTAERNVLSGLQPFGFRDVFRTLHGYEREASSWIVRRKALTVGRRFDHIFACEGLELVSCEYVVAWQEAGLSDHAAIEMVCEMSAG